MTAITKEAVETAIAKGAVSISGVWKALGGKGNISGSTTKKIRVLVPDIQDRLDSNKKKPTDIPGVPKEPSAPVTPTTKPAKDAKPKEAMPIRKSKFPRHPQNPFRNGSAYAICFDIMAAHPDGIARDKLLPLLGKETDKDEKHAAYDLSVLLSAKESPTGPRHRSCREGFWVKKEHQHYSLMLD